MATTTLVGSLDALRELITTGEHLVLGASSDVVAVMTAAAFIGAPQAAVAIAETLSVVSAPVEALMILDRAAVAEEYFATRIRRADAVVLADGSPLHAKSVWHDTPVGEAIRDAPRLVAIGATASVLASVMIDPRGGAPTVGLGYREGLVMTTHASDEQLARTRVLLGDDETLVVLGADGVIQGSGSSWRRLRGEVRATRGGEPVEF